jgi:hypothetical protein
MRTCATAQPMRNAQPTRAQPTRNVRSGTTADISMHTLRRRSCVVSQAQRPTTKTLAKTSSLILFNYMAMSTDSMESYFASSSRGRITGPISGSPNLTINTAMLQPWGDNESLMEQNYPGGPSIRKDGTQLNGFASASSQTGFVQLHWQLIKVVLTQVDIAQLRKKLGSVITVMFPRKARFFPRSSINHDSV